MEARVPASATRRGPNRVTLDFAWAESPRQVFPDPASRAVIGSTGVVSPVNIDVHSFDEAYISLFGADGAEVKASSGRRGYNVTVIHPRTGKVLEMRRLRHRGQPLRSGCPGRLSGRHPEGRIVAVATKGDAGANLTPAAVEALRGLGSRAQAPADLQRHGPRADRRAGRRAGHGGRGDQARRCVRARGRRLPHPGRRAGLGGIGSWKLEAGYWNWS